MSSERRLHPLTLLFELGRGLRELAIPMIVLIFVSRSRAGGADLSLPVILLLVTTALALARWLSFGYRYDPGELVIRSGIFVRNERHIPYDRIQNIDAVQNVIHRALGVVSVQVQTGAATGPEATLSVLPGSALDEMRARVFGGRGVPSATPEPSAGASVAASPVGRTLLHLPTRELLLTGLIENRGMVLILGALGLISQVEPLQALIADRLTRWIPGVPWSELSTESLTEARYILLAMTAVLLILVFVRLLSTVWAAVRLHDFRLTRVEDDLRVEYGLLTRVAATIPLRRIQTIAVHETLFHRVVGRAAVRVATAGGGTGSAGKAEREWIAPILRREAVPTLLDELEPGIDLRRVAWRGTHPRAFARLAARSSVAAVALTTAAAFFLEWWAIPIGVILLIRAVVWARVHVRNLGWGPTPNGVAFRTGWLRRITTAARFSRMQTVSLTASPLDRRAGMATVGVDTAAAELSMPYLARADALELRDLVARRAAATPFTW